MIFNKFLLFSFNKYNATLKREICNLPRKDTNILIIGLLKGVKTML